MGFGESWIPCNHHFSHLAMQPNNRNKGRIDEVRSSTNVLSLLTTYCTVAHGLCTVNDQWGKPIFLYRYLLEMGTLFPPSVKTTKQCTPVGFRKQELLPRKIYHMVPEKQINLVILILCLNLRCYVKVKVRNLPRKWKILWFIKREEMGFFQFISIKVQETQKNWGK